MTARILPNGYVSEYCNCCEFNQVGIRQTIGKPCMSVCKLFGIEISAIHLPVTTNAMFPIPDECKLKVYKDKLL